MKISYRLKMLSFLITTILIRNSLTYGNIEEEIYKNGGNGIIFIESKNNFVNNDFISGKKEIDFPINQQGNSNLGIIDFGNGIMDKVFSEYGAINRLNNFTNNGTISGAVKIASVIAVSENSNLGIVDFGNGIINGSGSIYGTAKSLNDFTNNGIINGKTQISSPINLLKNSILNIFDFGNGIINGSGSFYGIANILNNFTNNGTISGAVKIASVIDLSKNSSLYSAYLGNGIIDMSETANSLNNFTNNGTISGVVEITSKIAVSENSILNIFNFGNGITNVSNFGNKLNDFINNGTISGTIKITSVIDLSENSSLYSDSFGNGIVISFGNKEGNGIILNNSINNGVIGGNVEISSLVNLSENLTLSFFYFGNGITLLNSKDENGQNLNNFINNGVVSGNVDINLSSDQNINLYIFGNGIVSVLNSKDGTVQSLDNFVNNGIISGYFSKNILNDDSSGNGIFANKHGIMNNMGVIKGSNYAIFLGKDNTVENPAITNYGMLAGKNILGVYDNQPYKNYTNYGVEIKLDENNSIESISNGIGGNVVIDSTNKTIYNGTKNGDISNGIEIVVGNDSYILASKFSDSSSLSDLIINGAGVTTGALVIDKSTNLSNSIINGYETAVYVQGENRFTGIDVIFNGGGVKNDIAVIKGDDSGNIVDILGNSIINGSIDLGGGDDTLNLGSKLTKASSTINVFNNISGVENLNFNGNVFISEEAQIIGADEINIESGDLTLGINLAKVQDGKLVGHGLYGNTGMIKSTGGNLVLGVNGIFEDLTISMGNTKIDSSVSIDLKTNSLVLDSKFQEKDGDIKVSVIENLPIHGDTNGSSYNGLNAIYKSIVSAKRIGTLSNTTLLGDKTIEEASESLVSILNQIYKNNPYAYTLKSSRDSLKLFEDNISYLTIKPKAKEWIVQGKGVSTGIKGDDILLHGENYKTKTNTNGGLGTFEYGLSDKTSVGIILGGNNQNINLEGSSKVDGNAFYLGTFMKTNTNNFKLMSGLGYQYTSANGDRIVSNKYDYFKTDDRYNINSFNLFVEGKYILQLEQGYRLEPKIRLSYYHIDQDSIDEGYNSKNLSIKVDNQKVDTFDVELGGDLIKEMLTGYGKLNSIFSFGVIRTLGDREKDLNGVILGAENNGSRFKINGAELPDISGKVAYNLELEQYSGMIYNIGGSLEFAQKGNRNYSLQVGIGYKF
ncbi:MAG: autotransporter domain-containing protein [Cetobacterium sp.]|nr:autotransporter domain-containing protein [Cetobacterium sp.]